ncbi:MAG: endonuclease V [Candidatus Zixiibacteriota bacterium]|nr:MAG: endonuclease V [candidate division Zixibacteria bacterium]
MQFTAPEIWPETKEDALAAQKDDAGRVSLLSHLNDVKLVGAVDTAYGTNCEIIYAAAVVVSFPELDVLERTYYYKTVNFPYVPGLFFYREGPAMLGALAKLQHEPDLIVVHGHGIAHPRRCGIACQIGLVVDRPTIGCARKLLTGQHRPVPPARGSYQPIVLKSREIGWAYRSKDNVKPIFISPGHRCDLPQAREMIVKNMRGFRLPEPLRLAHLYANKFRRRTEQRNKVSITGETGE